MGVQKPPSKHLRRTVPALRSDFPGLPVGGDLEYADGVTLSQALEGGREL